VNFDDARAAVGVDAARPVPAAGSRLVAEHLDLPELPPQGEPADDAHAGPMGRILGATLFARYAYPPNELGYCGPPDSRALLQYGSAGVVDRGLGQLARGFAGAWPYLELIAEASQIPDPLDRRVVEAYWLGTDLVRGINMTMFGNSMWDRFRKRAGRSFGYLVEAIPEGAIPNHSFHVFGVYPWVGLLGGDRGDTPLHVLDRCRIRWGQVVAVSDESVDVLSRPLTWDGHELGLGENRVETATRSVNGLGFVDDYRPGDWVSLHWGWVCDRLSRRQLGSLRRSTLRQLDITNRRVAHSGPRANLG
jgi:hypothetical protein